MSYEKIYNIVGLNNELERLEYQAALGWPKEFRTLKWMGLKNGMKILDVGSGPGFYTELLLKNLPDSTVTDLEIDKKLITAAEKRLQKYQKNGRVNFKNESVYNAVLPQNTYDFAVCRLVLQHLDNPGAAVKQIYKALKPGGILVIIDNDKSLIGVSEPEYLINMGKNYYGKIEQKTKWNRKVGRKLVKILKAAGYKDIDFEAIALHSDVIGMKNMMKYQIEKLKQMIPLVKNIPQMNKIVQAYYKGFTSDKNTFILINFMAKGVKKQGM